MFVSPIFFTIHLLLQYIKNALYNYSFLDMSLSGRSNVTFDPKVCHFTTVPMILYPPKVSSEHLEDDVGTSVNHHRNDPKLTILTKNADMFSID